METPVTDVSARVEYRTDRWFMSYVPWALWFCVVGLAFVLFFEAPKLQGAAVAFVYVGLLGVAFAGWAAHELVLRSGLPMLVGFLLTLLLIVLVPEIIGRFSPAPDYRGFGRNWWSNFVNPPNDVFGWMMIYLGLGWVAYAVYRHKNPPAPMLWLSPEGISYHRFWLPKVFIPWGEVRQVGPLNRAPGGGPNTGAIAVNVGQGFYQRAIAPKRSALSPPGSEVMFQSEGEEMRMVLTCPEIMVEPAMLQAPIEARRAAFGQLPAAAPPAWQPGSASVVYGQWRLDAGMMQVAQFVAPVVAFAGLLLRALRH